MAQLTPTQLEKLARDKSKLFKEFLEAEPSNYDGEALERLWDQIYDEDIRNVIVETVTGLSDEDTNRVHPYEKLQAVIKDGGNWKWIRMWLRFDGIERRGTAYREGEELNFKMPNKAPWAAEQRVLVVGGGPIGLRTAIEMRMAGHRVTLFEKRREIKDAEGNFSQLGFTNRINRPHMWPFVRNDLAKLNGREFMSRQACYPVFTEPTTSSIGIDELQLLLLKNAWLLGVDIRIGVGYDDAKVRIDSKTCMPTWDVECTYDQMAATKWGKEKGKNTQNFDCLIGCDGPRTRVRETQQEHLGNIEKRKFMDCVGIVVNVQKVSKKRLREMGFEHGQEPGDMNRARMVFKEFFQKIQDKADAEIETLIYYKASFHNYLILVPKRSDLIKHGLSGKVFGFAAGRDAAGQVKMDEKMKLRNYCVKVIKAAGIPIDDNLPNQGFVPAPNDCMAFDFAEVWNCKQSMFFNVPPNDYDVTLDGPWMGRNLVPLVALAGDALLEPFWPLGLGLKRGYQALMDTCYAVDNLYNTYCFAKKLGKEPDDVTWDEHFGALREQVAANFELCARLKICPELGNGEYDPKGPVVMQLKKKFKDPEIPVLEVEVDPWTRYDVLANEAGDSWKTNMADEEWLHPKVQKALNMKEYYLREINYTDKKLVSINGKTIQESEGQKGTARVPRGKAKAKTTATDTGALTAGAEAKAATKDKPVPISGKKIQDSESRKGTVRVRRGKAKEKTNANGTGALMAGAEAKAAMKDKQG